MQEKIKYIGILSAVLLLASCSMTKGLKEGQQLHFKTNIDFLNPKVVPQKGKVAEQLAFIAKPVPATGLRRWQVGIYQWANRKGKEKGPSAWLKKTLGKPPVLFDETLAETSRQVMEKHLQDIGHFGATIKMDTTVSHKKVTVNYAVTSRGQYSVRNIQQPLDTLPLTHLLLENLDETLLETEKPYSQMALTLERNRLAELATANGFYEVNQDNFYYFVDTTAGEHQVDIFLKIKQTGDSSIYQVYHLGKTTVFPDFSLESDTTVHTLDTLMRRDLRIVQNDKILRPSVLARMIWKDDGAVFSKTDQRETINRLLNLGIFKIANIRFEKRVEQDTYFLDRVVLLTPGLMRDKSVSFEVNSRTGNFIGTEVSGSFSHKNLFHGAELLSLSLGTGLETNIGANAGAIINTLNLNAKASLELVGIYAPFIDRTRVRGSYLPRTAFSVGDDFQQRNGFFTLNSFNLSAGYRWRKNRFQHELNPFFVNVVDVLQTSNQLDELLRQNNRLRASFENVLIAGASYNLSLSNQDENPAGRHYYFRGGVETAGHLLYLVPNDNGNFLGIPVAQYMKFDLDFRQYFPVRKGQLAGRAFFGVGLPQGNSQTLPYVKQYFIGGASSVRAFRIRTLGPGSFESKLTDGSNYIDQTGDLKLELNMEYRFPVFPPYIKSAVFVDAGNIWLVKGDADESTPEADGRFRFNSFYQEIAVGTGIGLRIDFDVAVIRLDWAFPIRKPSLETGAAWLFSEIKPLERTWRRQNIVWNLAIGYPF
ncbi:MAG: BamA/TamA family outer membrane protein [Bacteroidetes bacterium]|nr:BamA/TamA family outer membrane protein [Bacteroidota bacterium]